MSPVPWGLFHFLRHWLKLSRVDWFMHCQEVPNGGLIRCLGRCLECKKIIRHQ